MKTLHVFLRTLALSVFCIPVTMLTGFAQDAGDIPAGPLQKKLTAARLASSANSADTIITVLPTIGSTSGNARAPQGSRLYANSKYIITGAEMTTSGFTGAVSSVGWRWNLPRPTGAGAPAAQSVATTGNLRVFMKDTTSDAVALIGTFIDTNGVGYTKVIDATISITRTDTVEFTIDVPAGGPGTSLFTPTPGNGVLVIFTYTTTTPLATPLGAPTVACNTTLAGTVLLTYQSQTVNGTTGSVSTFRPETRFGSTPTPVDTLLVILQDTTTNSVKKRADHDSLFTYLPSLYSAQRVVFIDTAGASLPNLAPYTKILYSETSFDAARTRWLGASARAALKAWLNSGTPANKKSLVMMGADLSYNHSRNGSGARDTVLTKDMLKFTYRVDNGNVTGQNSITGVGIDPGLALPLNTAPAGGGFYPDGSFPEAGGTTLYRYTGRTPNDTVAGVGYSATGYTSAVLFVDPREFNGPGTTTGLGRALRSLMEYTGMIPSSTVHDIGVSNLARTTANDLPVKINEFTDVPEEANVINLSAGENPNVTFFMADTARFRAIVQNYGTFAETTYQVRFTVDGSTISTVNNARVLQVGARDTFDLAWNTGTPGPHVARAFTILGTDVNRDNDTASANFTISGGQPLPGDTLYSFVVPSQIILGVAKIGSSNKLAFTSGGQSSAVTTDNKWVVTTLSGTILDTTHLQINPTTGQGFGFRDLAWDGRWLLTSDNAQLRRIDTATYTEVATRITGPGTLQRGVAWEMTNRIWKSNFTTDPVVKFDTAGATVKTLGTPTVAPYGIAFDRWTSPNRGYLWYAEPSLNGTIRLTKVDTATGALMTSYDYSTMFPATTVGGLDIVNDHPSYPGSVVAFMVIQRFPVSICVAINLGPDSSVALPPATEQRRDHVTSAFRATVTNEGTIGSLNAFVGTGPGNGFQFNPVSSAGQRLFEGAIMLGLDSVRVSDGARNSNNPEAFDADFKFLTLIDSTMVGTRTTMTTSFTDSLAETPFGARIAQRTVSWDSAGLNNFLIFELDVTNTSAAQWTTLHAGGFFDWDVNPANAQDRGAVVVDSTNTIPGVNGGNPFRFDMLELHQAATPNSWMGIVPLNENRFRGRRIAISSTEVYPPRMTNGDKWRYMTTNRATNPDGDGGSAVDHAQVFGVGPYTVAANATKRVGFAMFGGTSLADAVSAARAAQRAWVQRLGNSINVITTGVRDENAGIPETFDLAQNYPNPFNPTTTIRYALPEQAHVTLSIYNLLGQRVAELTNEVQAAGYYNAVWNGRNQAGSQVATGVYFYRIEATPANGGAPFISLKKALLIK